MRGVPVKTRWEAPFILARTRQRHIAIALQNGLANWESFVWLIVTASVLGECEGREPISRPGKPFPAYPNIHDVLISRNLACGRQVTLFHDAMHLLTWMISTP
jgi:hypothetical protein